MEPNEIDMLVNDQEDPNVKYQHTDMNGQYPGHLIQNQYQQMPQNNYMQSQTQQNFMPQQTRKLSGLPMNAFANQKYLNEDQQKMVIRKAMILDKADRRKTDTELQSEIEQLKIMRNKDETDIKLLKVELQKVDISFKKYKDIGGLQNINPNNMIQLPERFLNRLNKNAPNTDLNNDQNQDQNAILNTQSLLDDMNFVKNQL